MPHIGESTIDIGVRLAVAGFDGIRVLREPPSIDGDVISFRIIDEINARHTYLSITYEAYMDSRDVIGFIRDSLLRAIVLMRNPQEGGAVPPPQMPNQRHPSFGQIWLSNPNLPPSPAWPSATTASTQTISYGGQTWNGDGAYQYRTSADIQDTSDWTAMPHNQPRAVDVEREAPYPPPPEYVTARVEEPATERGPSGFRAIPKGRPIRRALPC